MQIKFVRCERNRQDEPSETLKTAFVALQETSLNPEWITEEECLKLDRNSDVFVCDPFEGPSFTHLKRLKCRILGPQCVIWCMEKREYLPKLPYPVYTATMKGVVVSCTSMEKKTRVELYEKIQLMGGEVSGNLTSSVTHLVAGEVGSKKYHVACSLSKPVMLPDWVFECWKIGLTKNIHASDSLFGELKCPVFKGLHITVSQVDSDKRKEIQKVVTSNGGKYSGELRANDTTHLIAIHPEGQKYHFARQWKIHCVMVSWLFDSLEKGFCMDELLYSLSNNSNNITKTSTPVLSSKNDVQSLPNTSSISNSSIHSRINETYRSDISSLNQSLLEENPSLYTLDSLSLEMVSKAGNFLDGCKMFISGFSDVHLEKLRKIVNMGGGTRFSQLCDSVSHVVVNAGTHEHVQLLENLQLRPHVVTVDWIIKSCRIGRLAEETLFLALESDKQQSEAVFKHTLEKTNATQSPSAGNRSIYDDEVMCQYLNKSGLALDDEIVLKAAQEVQEESLSEMDHVKELSNTLGKEHFEVLNHDGETNENIENAGIFNNMTFVILGFDNEDFLLLEDMISENKGNVIPLNNTLNVIHPINYGVVPLLGCDIPVTVSETVTNYWVQMCLEKAVCLPLTNKIFRPLSMNIDIRPLSGCVLSISQYSGTERDALMCLAEILGANYQEFFVRKANSNSNLIPSTHLVCITADGSKYKGAVSWGLPAVTKEWLLACADVGAHVPEDEYLVGTTRKSNHDGHMSACESAIQKSVLEHPNCQHAAVFIDKVVDMQTPVDSPKPTMNQKVKCDTPVAKRVFTPLRLHRPQFTRIKELIHEDRISRPQSPECAGVDTPGKFLDPPVPFKPSFDFSEVVQILNSPSNNEAHRRRSSVSIEDCLGVNLQQAVTQSQQKNFNPSFVKVPLDVQHDLLSSVIICVSKKLSAEQGELNDIVTALGGNYRWTYDSCCTHFIYRGKSGDISKELRIAREQRKKIVSPDWLYMCNQNKLYENEELYPFTYNANMKLEVKPTKVNLRSKAKKGTDSLTSQPKDLSDASDGDQSTVAEFSSMNSTSSSSDNQTSVNRQMELMLATKTGKGNKKRKQASSPFVQPSEGNHSIAQSRSASPSRTKGGTSEVSSSVPITWDDPTARLEREKLAEQLAKESQSLSPDFLVSNQNKKNENVTRTSDGNNKENDNHLHPPTFSSALSNSKHGALKPAPRLMLSGMSNQERTDYAVLVTDLGGSVSDGQHFDNECTHLVVSQPSRNEKFLASVAAGKWILHKSYLEACKQENRFVEESAYEWGGEMMFNKMPLTNPQLLKIAQSAHRWRLKLSPSQTQVCSGTLKAFHGWNVIVYTDHQRELSFQRLLKAGGATVVQAKFPFSNPENASFAFLELGKAPSKEVDLRGLLHNGVQCVKPEYIAAFLTEEPAPCIQNFYIPEVRDLLDEGNSISAGKRKSGSNLVQRVKKNRR